MWTRSGLLRRQMAPHEPVFMPDQAHHEDVEHGERENSNAVRVREAVQLIDDEESQYDEGRRIRPELVPKKADDKQQFHHAMAKQIKGIEMLRPDGKLLRHDAQMCCDEILRILDQFFPCQRIDQVRNRPCADQSKGDAAYTFDRCKRTLEQYAELKNLMNSMFVHVRAARPKISANSSEQIIARPT